MTLLGSDHSILIRSKFRSGKEQTSVTLDIWLFFFWSTLSVYHLLLMFSLLFVVSVLALYCNLRQKLREKKRKQVLLELCFIIARHENAGSWRFLVIHLFVKMSHADTHGIHRCVWAPSSPPTHTPLSQCALSHFTSRVCDVQSWATSVRCLLQGAF